MQEEKFPTDNGSEGAKWNYINREVKDDMEEGRYQIEVLYRGPWKFLGIYDRIFLHPYAREESSFFAKKSEYKTFSLYEFT